MSRFARLTGLLGTATTLPILFRSTSLTTAASPLTKPAGVAVGDLVIVTTTKSASGVTLSTASGDTWSKTEISWSLNVSALWIKVLNATDVSNNWNVSDAGIDYRAVAYRADDMINAGTVKTATGDIKSGTTATLTGYTPSADSKGAIGVLIDRTTSGDITPPTGFTERAESVLITTYDTEVCDNATYTGGNISWTVDAANQAAGYLIEVT